MDSNIIVGYHRDSFVRGLLVDRLKIDRSMVKNYSDIKEYKEALDRGSHKDGVDAIFDQVPYIKIFLKQNGSNYAMVATRDRIDGFGFIPLPFNVNDHPVSRIASSLSSLNVEIYTTVDSKIKKEDEEIAAKGSFIHLLLKSRRSYPPLTTRTELRRLLSGTVSILISSFYSLLYLLTKNQIINFCEILKLDTPKLLRNLLNACELKRFRLESLKTQHFCQMAYPNRYCYGFLLMISCSCGVLLIAPIEAEDDAGSLLGGKKLIIGLPYKSGYTPFVDVQQLNSSNNNQVVQVGGYSINVFDATIAYLKRSNYNISFEYRAFVDEEGNSAGDYDALVHQIFEGKYDAVVGDVTILAKRLNYADFTLPYTHSNVKMLVKVRHDPRLNMWIFVRPFSWSLWLSIAIISTFIGGILLFMERNVNKDSTHENSPCRKQFNGISILWFPVVQAIFPERESLAKNCSRFVLAMWLILVFVLMQSYTASLSSILTIHQLQPRYLSENDVTEDPNIIVGYNHGSFVGDLLINGLKIHRSRVKSYASIKAYKEALDKGSRKVVLMLFLMKLPTLRLSSRIMAPIMQWLELGTMLVDLVLHFARAPR
ncbi:glutamate receptor 2.7-like [Prosopis cineraria]|uniref:glutamate receptor 2.7-like n=1 Tax=Prosopis cineraria TaxID=364024 RepID=UPI00240EFC3E|nr:glutamate receptor 2.7-like [Prosopis cineraria]